jgi:hypothetical protein
MAQLSGDLRPKNLLGRLRRWFAVQIAVRGARRDFWGRAERGTNCPTPNR